MGYLIFYFTSRNFFLGISVGLVIIGLHKNLFEGFRSPYNEYTYFLQFTGCMNPVNYLIDDSSITQRNTILLKENTA